MWVVTPESQRAPGSEVTPQKVDLPSKWSKGSVGGKGGRDQSGNVGTGGKGAKGKGGKGGKGGRGGDPPKKQKGTGNKSVGSAGSKAPTEKSAIKRANDLVNEYEACKRQDSTAA